MARGDFIVKLTKENVWTLPGRKGQRTEYTDTVCQGLILSISENGARSFRYQYRVNGEQERYTIGPLEKTDLAGARLFIKNCRKTGANPAKEKREAKHKALVSTDAPTFEVMADAFVEDQSKFKSQDEPGWKPSVRVEWTRLIKKELKPLLGDLAPAAVTSANIRDLIDAIKKRPSPTTARRTFEVVRRMFKWAIHMGYVSVSPCVAAAPFERRRKRLNQGKVMKPFSDVQLQGLFFWAKGSEIENLLDLIARTGVRSHEARSARPDAIRNGTWSIDPKYHKNGGVTGKPHLVPLSKGALRVFERLKDGATQWYFPAPCKCIVCEEPGHMDRPNSRVLIVPIKKKAGIEGRGFFHRMRDTIKTRMSENGIPERVSEHILGHVIPGIAGTYDHSELLEERQEALEWWSQELDNILRKKGKK